MSEHQQRLRELALIFLRLGFTSFGGPAAHIALMEREFVQKREWLSRQKFLDLNGAVNLIPGPNSTELAMYIGQMRAGRAGLWTAGACFILPAAFIVLAIAAFYEKYGRLPAGEAILRGIAPVVVAIVVVALWKFAGTALKGAFPIVIAGLALALSFFGINEVVLIFGTALLGLLYGFWKHPREKNHIKTPQAMPFLLLSTAPLFYNKTLGLFFVFLKIGSVIYGSGYVLLAFLQGDLVDNLGWLTQRELLDAVAVGQMTPGPVFTTATFVGYLVAGVPGAIMATLGIFLPSFLLVGLLSSIVKRAENSPLMRTFLDAVNAASLALMAAVTLELGRHALAPQNQISLIAIALFLVSLALLLKTKINSAWLIGVGALCGWLFL
jgi:chromate transporter